MSNNLTIGKILYAALNGVTSAGSNVFPLIVPVEKGVPAIAYNVMNTRPDKIKDKRSAVDRVTVEICIMDHTLAGCNTIASLCRDTLEGYTPASGEGYLDAIRFEQEYYDYEESANLHLKYQEYEFRTRNTSVACSPMAINFPHVGGTATIKVIGSAPWTAAKSQVWITITPAEGAVSGTITVTAGPNGAGAARSGTVTVTSSSGIVTTVAITQDAAII